MRGFSVLEMGVPVSGEGGVMGWGGPGMAWKGFRGLPMLMNWGAGGWKGKNGGPEVVSRKMRGLGDGRARLGRQKGLLVEE